ncbi:hypothetical protein BGW80DRAFT_596485 [Lactifluus volemus]|nr:hypothetical protein BGW80DRAFT_596485 [Lactifluus volemus]
MALSYAQHGRLLRPRNTGSKIYFVISFLTFLCSVSGRSLFWHVPVGGSSLQASSEYLSAERPKVETTSYPVRTIIWIRLDGPCAYLLLGTMQAGAVEDTTQE